MQFTMKQKTGSKWQPVDLTPLTDVTVECLLLNFCETETVAEFILDSGEKVYLCGTDNWVEHFQKRGLKAALLEHGVEALKILMPEFMDNKPSFWGGGLPPLVHDAVEVFGEQVTVYGDSPVLQVG